VDDESYFVRRPITVKLAPPSFSVRPRLVFLRLSNFARHTIGMDVVKAVETYITKLVSTPSAMKVLLLDTHTTPIVSLASTQSTLLSHQVYLTDRIDNRLRNPMPHMKCVCFLQPSEGSIEAVCAELREPKYGEYYLYFSNVLSKSSIERLAEVDEFEVVREVQEYFADYAPLLSCLFSLNHLPTVSKPLYGSSPNSWENTALEHSVQGIIAVLLSLKKKPVIRYEKMSGMARKLANEIQHRIQAESALFDFRLTQVAPLLLILDRRNDPVTPLLSQWTYQAMVHELLGIQNGRVNLSMVPDIGPELSASSFPLDMFPPVPHTLNRKLLSRPPLTRFSKHITWRRLVILVLHWQTMSNLINHGRSLNLPRPSTQYLT
jgi:hypothetical protein